MSCNVPVASTNMLIYIRHAFNFVYFKSPVLFLLGKPAKLFLKLLTLIGLYRLTWEMKLITVAKVPLQQPKKDMKDQ